MNKENQEWEKEFDEKLRTALLQKLRLKRNRRNL